MPFVDPPMDLAEFGSVIDLLDEPDSPSSSSGARLSPEDFTSLLREMSSRALSRALSLSELILSRQIQAEDMKTPESRDYLKCDTILSRQQSLISATGALSAALNPLPAAQNPQNPGFQAPFPFTIPMMGPQISISTGPNQVGPGSPGLPHGVLGASGGAYGLPGGSMAPNLPVAPPQITESESAKYLKGMPGGAKRGSGETEMGSGEAGGPVVDVVDV
jgi:hypothetical protein